MSWEVVMETSLPVVISYERERLTAIEEGHGTHNLSGMYNVIKNVKVYIGEFCVDITDSINLKMEDELHKHINEFENDLR